MYYKDKVVVITNCDEGIGESCARVFAEAGAVVVVASHDEQNRDAFTRELNEHGVGKAHFIQHDAINNEGIEKWVVNKLGKIDCLINNIGLEQHKLIDEFSVGEFRELLESNLISTFAVCKVVLPYLRLTKGNIINVSKFDVPYNTTKGAINSFTKALAVDEAAYEVRVNSISIDVLDAAKQKKIFEEAARMCLFLASDATFTTGVNHIIE